METERKKTSLALALGGLLAAGLVLTACQQSRNTAQTIDPAGIYNLKSVDGHDVPAKVSHDGHQVEVRSGVFTINSDGTCGTTTVFVPPNGSEITRKVDATYTQSGSKLTMRWKGAGMTAGTVEGDTFTMNNEGMIFVYRK
jgi:hypothetical protein